MSWNRTPEALPRARPRPRLTGWLHINDEEQPNTNEHSLINN